MTQKGSWISLVLVITVSSLPGQAWEQKVAALLDTLYQQNDIPGLSIGIIMPNGESFAAARGWTDEAHTHPLTPNHLLQAGSIGKTYVAAIAMQLVEAGQLQLDVPVGDYLGNEVWFDSIPNARQVTVRMLMNHTSGIPEHVQESRFLSDVLKYPDKNYHPVELLRYIMGKPAHFEAGRGWSYADTNYILLGMIIEQVTRRRFYALAREYLLTPLKLYATIAAESRVIRGLANGFSMPDSPFGFEGPTLHNDTFVINPQLEWTGGGFATTPLDLARWAKILYEGGAFSPALLPEMLHGVSAKLGPNTQYGLGVIISQSPLGVTYGHSGWFPGYVSEVKYFKDDGFSIAIQFNTDDMSRVKGFARYMLPLAQLVAQNLPHESIKAFQHVNVIPMDSERVLPDQTVIVGNNKIKSIGPASTIVIPAGAEIVDGQGKFMIPGLTDVHAHFFTEQEISPKTLPLEAKLMLANGVTTARIQCGDSLYLDLRKRIDGNTTTGPDLFISCPQLVGRWPFRGLFFGKVVQTPEEAKAAIQQFAQQGYDAIKVTFFMQPPAYEAIAKEARAWGLRLTGHVGPDVGLPRALAAGQQVEHMDEFLEQLLPQDVGTNISVSGTSIWNRKAWSTVDQLDSTLIPALVAKIKAAGIAVAPTHYFLHTSFGYGQTEEEIRQRPDFKYLPEKLKEDRFGTRNFFWNDPPSEERRRQFVQLRYQLTRALQKAGVPLLCGSDSPEWFIVQGFSVHYELEEMVRAGLPPFAALQTATVNPAQYLGIHHQKGTITPGKTADFLLLDANPLEDIRNTRRIAGVCVHGQYWNRKALDALLEEAKQLNTAE